MTTQQTKISNPSNEVTEKILNGPLGLGKRKTISDQIAFNSSQLCSEEEIIANAENR